MMKKLLWVILAILFAFSAAEAKTVDRILAQVNDEIITMSEVNRLMEVQGVRSDSQPNIAGMSLSRRFKRLRKQCWIL